MSAALTTVATTEEICCAICLDTVDISMNVIKTECKHCFHSNCFLQNAAHNGFSCPMCRNELASVPTDDEDDDEDDYNEDNDDEEEDFALRGARWLMMRAEGEEIEEDDTDDESTGSSEYDDEDFVRYGNDENTNPTIAEISQRLIARGITYEQIVALYILPHHANAADVQTYSRSVIRDLENQVYDVLSVPPAN